MTATDASGPAEAVAWPLRRGQLVGLAVGPGSVAAAVPGKVLGVVDLADAATLEVIDAEVRPRWAVWSAGDTRALVAAGVRLRSCWDLTAVDGLLHGGWRADPGRVWARAAGLSPGPDVPHGPRDLFHQDLDDAAGGGGPLLADGRLHPDWGNGAETASVEQLGRWAELAVVAAGRQRTRLAALTDRPMAITTAHAESTAELLCVELAHDGLPFDRVTAEAIVAGFVGARPRSDADAAQRRAERDELVLRHAPAGTAYLLRNPAHVKALLRGCGVEVADTRAWRLETQRHVHPVVDALLTWRKAERVATTFGYDWLDAHVGDGRLRGDWTASDGAAGRMTASVGLHNLPSELRPAVAAGAGHRFVRADLGQIEPRVLAAVSADPALTAATAADDLYLPVARDLGVDRPTAKVAVLGAMYGQTTGHGAVALRRLEAAYPTAMALLAAAAVDGEVGSDLRTWGGRRIRLSTAGDAELDSATARRRAAARGRFARNAAIQGAAAELFKVWAVTVRARLAALDARIVLCLHDELLVHSAAEHASEAAAVVSDALGEAAQRWSPGTAVRFVADVSIVERWSDAKS